MAATATGTVFNVQRYSLHDGPGIRTTVFLKGCPLSCAWCHNPEGRAPERELRRIPARCVRCGQCVEQCPQGGMAREHLPHQADHCTVCGACVDACPTAAREIVGREMTVDQVVAEVLRDRLFFDQSGGGVTVSGGEPSEQAAFTSALFDALRRESIHVVLDTCGYAPAGTFLGVAERADLVLYDVKTVDDAVHRRYTGVSNEQILANLAALARTQVPIWARIPLVPGVNADANSLAQIARFLASLGGIQQVNLLPYHALGTGKASADQGQQPASCFQTPSAASLQRAVAVFQSAGFATIVGG